MSLRQIPLPSFNVLEMCRLIPRCQSLLQLSIGLGLSPSSNSNVTLRKWIAISNTDTSHFKQKPNLDFNYSEEDIKRARNKAERYYGLTKLCYCVVCDSYVEVENFFETYNACLPCKRVRAAKTSLEHDRRNGVKPKHIVKRVYREGREHVKCTKCLRYKDASNFCFFKNIRADGALKVARSGKCNTCKQKEVTAEQKARRSKAMSNKYKNDPETRGKLAEKAIRNRKELTDTYIKELITAKSSRIKIARRDIPPEMIIARRIILQSKRDQSPDGNAAKLRYFTPK